MDMISAIYLPGSIDGKFISDSEQAGKIALDYTKQRINLFAEKIDRTVKCIYGCERKAGDGVIILKLVKNGFSGDEYYNHNHKEYLNEELYDPPALYVSITTTKLGYGRRSPMTERILGFAPAWKSDSENGWQVQLFGSKPYDEKEEFKVRKHKIFVETLGYQLYQQTGSPLGRVFYRILTGGSKRIIFGDDTVISPQFVALKGDFYHIFAHAYPHFSVKRVNKETDESYLRWVSKKDRVITATEKEKTSPLERGVKSFIQKSKNTYTAATKSYTTQEKKRD